MDNDSNAPKEFTGQQGMQQDKEIRKIQRENKARVVREVKERHRQWAQKLTPRSLPKEENTKDETESEIREDSEDEKVENKPIPKRRDRKISSASLCYGYKTKGSAISAGCEVWEQPTWRNERQTFVLRSGNFRPVNGRAADSVYDRNLSLSPSDCRDICWNDCQCAAYILAIGMTGCVYGTCKNLEFEQSLDGSAIRKYVLDTAPSGKGMKKHIKIILGVVSIIVLLVFGMALFIVRKLKQGKREEELQELLTLEGYTDDNGGGKNHVS